MTVPPASAPSLFPVEGSDLVVGEPYVPDPTQPEAVVGDVDGTLAHMDGRSPYEFDRVDEDAVDPSIRRLVQLLAPSVRILLLTGRDDSCAEHSRRWLHRHGIPFDELHMRAAGDRRSDSRVKLEIFDTHFRPHFNIVAVIEDRNAVVDMWRAMGVKCLQPQDGDF